MAGVAMMETYHRYRLYRSMMYGGYGKLLLCEDNNFKYQESNSNIMNLPK